MNATTARSYHWLFGCLALSGFCLDQVSKYEVFRRLYPIAEPDKYGQLVGEVELIPGVFSFHAGFTQQRETGSGILAHLRTYSSDVLPHVNQGALFGQGHTFFGNGNIFFAVVSVGAALAIIAYMWSRRSHTRHDRFLSLSLGLILAGTLGNLYERGVFPRVRAFLFCFLWIDWPIFNLADCCLVCGAGLLLLQAFFSETHPAPPAANVAFAKEPEVAEVK